jgi:hypothetical protein
MRFELGMELNMNDECIGTVTKMTEERIFIESECFRGWATKAEISAATRSATQRRSRNKQARSRPSAA